MASELTQSSKLHSFSEFLLPLSKSQLIDIPWLGRGLGSGAVTHVQYDSLPEALFNGIPSSH